MGSGNAENSWVIIDTHLWIPYFAGEKNLETDAIHERIIAKRVCLAGPILYEILVGPKKASDRRTLEVRLSRIPMVSCTDKVRTLAVQLGQEANARSLELPTFDILIAAHCYVYNLSLYTLDHHFDFFGKLRRFCP